MNFYRLLRDNEHEANHRAARLGNATLIKQTKTFSWRAAMTGFVALLFCGLSELAGNSGASDSQQPADVVRSYIRALYARDFAAAYGLISSEDRRQRSMDQYVRQRGGFSGFVLEAARKASEAVDLQILEQRQISEERIRIRIRYRVPDSKALAPLLLNWDPYRLNALNAADRTQLLDALQRLRQERSLKLITGEGSFNLVKENAGWRLFLDWAAGVKIPFRLEQPRGGALQATLSNAEVRIQPGDTFEVRLRVKNHTNQSIVARIGHLVEPLSAADYLDFVQCGFLLPVTVAAGKEEEFSGTYLLRGSLPDEIRELRLTYDFKILE